MIVLFPSFIFPLHQLYMMVFLDWQLIDMTNETWFSYFNGFNLSKTFLRDQRSAFWKKFFLIFFFSLQLKTCRAEPHSSVGSVADLITGSRWFDPPLGQYSFPGLIIVIATGFIPLSPPLVLWESSQWLGKNIVQSTGWKNSRKAYICALASTMQLKYYWKRH